MAEQDKEKSTQNTRWNYTFDLFPRQILVCANTTHGELSLPKGPAPNLLFSRSRPNEYAVRFEGLDNLNF